MDYYYEYQWDGSYCYPDSNVLINKMGITNAEDLHCAERDITSLNISMIKAKPITGCFDLAHLKLIHKSIFSDVYPWAGQLRIVDISKGNIFCMSQHLEMYAESIFSKLKKEQYLINTDESDIVQRLSFYLSEINVLHPFREGNGRTQRVFIEYLAAVAGYHVDFSSVSPDQMIKASAEAFARQYDLMNNMFSEIISPISIEEQQQYVDIFSEKCPQIKEIYDTSFGAAMGVSLQL